jgi:Cdc6-like AAA superfamily ATPase
MLSEMEKINYRVGLTSAFRPGAPVDTQDFLAGRTDQLTDILNATWQPGRHVILFGERGVGKTSVAKVIVQIKASAGSHVLDSKTINCDESDDFSSIWHKAFGSLDITIDDKPATLDELLPEIVTPDHVRYALSRLEGNSLIVLDELDQLKNEAAKNLMAATIKNLSDHLIDTTLLLVGVADTLDDLIAQHKSIERALVQVQMPRMTTDELKEIVNKGVLSVSMTITDHAKSLIPRFSLGLPYYTHSLALYSGLRAVDQGRTEIIADDVLTVTATAVTKSHSILSMYHKAATSPQPANLYADVLLACALTTPDVLGFFAPADISSSMSAIMGKRYYVPAYVRHLNEFCDSKRGPVLHKVGEAYKARYRFVDPLMQPFIILKALSERKIDEHLNVIQSRSAETVH